MPEARASGNCPSIIRSKSYTTIFTQPASIVFGPDILSIYSIHIYINLCTSYIYIYISTHSYKMMPVHVDFLILLFTPVLTGFLI